MKQKLNGILSIIIYLAQLLSLGIFAYLLVAQILNLLAMEEFIDPRAFERDYLKFLITVGLTTATISTGLLIATKKMARVRLLSLSRLEQLTYVFIAASFAYFFSTDKYLSVGKEVIIFFPVFAVLLFTIPNLIESFTKCNLLDFRRSIMQYGPTPKGHRTRLVAQLFSIIVAVVVLSINIVLVMVITTDYITGNTTREADLRRTLHIVRVSHTGAAQGEKVILYGYNMGWNEGGRSNIYSTGGPISTGVWNNNEVEFEIPLQFKEGTWQVWVRKPKKDDDPKSELVTSNKVSLRVVSRFEYYPDADDSFFERQYKKVKRFIFL